MASLRKILSFPSFSYQDKNPHHLSKMMRSGMRVASRAVVARPAQSRNSSLQVTVSGLNYVGTGMIVFFFFFAFIMVKNVIYFPCAVSNTVL